MSREPVRSGRFGTCRSHSEKLEAANVQSGQNVQFFIKGEEGMLHWARLRGIKGVDVYAMMEGKDCGSRIIVGNS